ncbi:GNAT family N-acetyltransferase, partial [Parabacteroides distasonis]
VFCFFAGEVNAELIAYKPDTYTIPFIIMRADTPSLKAAIQAQYGERAKKVTRYAIKKETDSFSQQYLQHIVETLSPEYEL